MKKYERVAGTVTRGETFAKLNEELIECEELCAVMAHLHNTEDAPGDRGMAQGWRALSEMFHNTRIQIVRLAKGNRQ